MLLAFVWLFSFPVVCQVVGCCRGSDGKFELDFESNPADIINSEHHEMDAVYRPVVDYKPEYRRSLRVSGYFSKSLYCSIIIFQHRSAGALCLTIVADTSGWSCFNLFVKVYITG